MKRIENIKEALVYLNDGYIISSDKYREIYLKNDKVHFNFEGNGFVLSKQDFFDLFQNINFYLDEDDKFKVDEEKDEAYYRYYKK